MLKIWIVTLFLWHSVPALALNKCAQNGTTLYGDQITCSGEQSTIVTTHPTTEEIKQSKQNVAHDQKHLQQLQKERHQQELEDEKTQQQHARRMAAKKKKCAQLELHKKWKEEDVTHAQGRSAEKAKRQLKRITEQFQLECTSTFQSIS